MFLIRPARRSDASAVYRLAGHLDSMNLPRDRALTVQLIDRSIESFSVKSGDFTKAEYLFILEHLRTRRVVGTSCVIAKHGTPESPHFFLAIKRDIRESRRPRRRFEHKVLQMGFTLDGPTEIGGLIVLPRYRRHRERLGLQLSLARFTFMALHPERFQKKVLAELRSPLDRVDRNLFWEVYGRRFTGMSYKDADRLSIIDKKFIFTLFPMNETYLCLFPEKVQRRLGNEHPEATPARRILEKAGFRYINQIDPFDAGPYFTAPFERIKPIRSTRRYVLGPPLDQKGRRTGIIAAEDDGGFRAIRSAYSIGRGTVRIERERMEALRSEEGTEVGVTPSA